MFFIVLCDLRPPGFWVCVSRLEQNNLAAPTGSVTGPGEVPIFGAVPPVPLNVNAPAIRGQTRSQPPVQTPQRRRGGRALGLCHPNRVISKWRCGPVELPEFPMSPMFVMVDLFITQITFHGSLTFTSISTLCGSGASLGKAGAPRSKVVKMLSV